MAKKKKEGLFTKAALEKLSSPEQLDVMMEVTKPAGWVALGAVGFLLAVVILWSIFGSIPTTVDGQGILMRGVALVDVEAKTEGSIRKLEVKVGDEIQIGQPIASVSQGGLQVQIQTLEDEIAQKKLEYKAAETEARAAVAKQVSSLQDSLQTLLVRLESQKTGLREANTELVRARENRARGLTTQSQVTAAQSKLRSISEGILGLEQQTKEIPGQIAALEAQIAETERARLLELSALERDLANKVRSIDSAKMITSTATGRVIELLASVGTLVSSRTIIVRLEPFDLKETQRGTPVGLPSSESGVLRSIGTVNSFVKKGDPIALIIDGDEEKIVSAADSGRVKKVLFAEGDRVKNGDLLVHLQPMDIELVPSILQAVIYVPAGEGKHINQNDVVRISPSTVKAEEYGFMLGEVMSISGYPITRDGMMGTLKNDGLVQEFSADGAPLEVSAQLQVVPGNQSGYAWSSGEGPPIGIQGGTKCTVSIVVDERAPISYVLPILKSATGL
ncbi:MAG: HlyD family secretion protein [Verrucomicrobiales bacterium]|jgi:HlyD family secretion protein